MIASRATTSNGASSGAAESSGPLSVRLVAGRFYAIGVVLPPGYERDKITIQSYLAVVKSGAVEMWGEALADLAALLYLRQAVPDRWQYFANELAGMRERFAEKYPAHNTGPWLRKAIAADAKVATNQNLFEAAFALRRRFEAEETPKAPSKK